jgi:hypothetical protein
LIWSRVGSGPRVVSTSMRRSRSWLFTLAEKALKAKAKAEIPGRRVLIFLSDYSMCGTWSL